MEQSLSFIALIVICSIMVALNLPIAFLITFFGGGTYLGIRGRRKGWNWRR
jgi:hypothetical protein